MGPSYISMPKKTPRNLDAMGSVARLGWLFQYWEGFFNQKSRLFQKTEGKVVLSWLVKGFL